MTYLYLIVILSILARLNKLSSTFDQETCQWMGRAASYIMHFACGCQLYSGDLLLRNENLVRLFTQMDLYRRKHWGAAENADEELKEKSLTTNGRGMLCSSILFLISLLNQVDVILLFCAVVAEENWQPTEFMFISYFEPFRSNFWKMAAVGMQIFYCFLIKMSLSAVVVIASYYATFVAAFLASLKANLQNGFTLKLTDVRESLKMYEEFLEIHQAASKIVLKSLKISLSLLGIEKMAQLVTFTFKSEEIEYVSWGQWVNFVVSIVKVI